MTMYRFNNTNNNDFGAIGGKKEDRDARWRKGALMREIGRDTPAEPEIAVNKSN